VEHAGEHPAPVRQRPHAGVDVPAAVEDVENLVEVASQRVVVAVDAPAEVGQLALVALGLTGGPHPFPEFRIELDGVALVGAVLAGPGAGAASRLQSGQGS
jgi:hypothetical protein